MSKLTFPLIITLLVLWLIGATWWFNKNYSQADSFDDADCSTSFILQDGNFQTKSEKTFIFEKSDWEPTIPTQMLKSLKSVALHLENNIEKTLILKGWFGLDETNNSDFRNNGIARAEALKNELVTYGAPQQNILVSSDSALIIELNCGKVLNGVDFKFSNAEKIAKSSTPQIDKKEIPKNPKEIPSKNSSERTFDAKKTYMIFYAENTFKPKMDEEIDDYLRKLSAYLKEHPKDRLLVMGHTDNSGNPKKHFNFGKYRARKMRDVILEYGVKKKRIKTDSKGSSKPLGSNKTSEGRFKNRRIEISIIHR